MRRKELAIHYRTLAATRLVLTLIVTSAAPAEAIIDSISGAIQRAQMIANQVTQIANQGWVDAHTANRNLSYSRLQQESEPWP